MKLLITLLFVFVFTAGFFVNAYGFSVYTDSQVYSPGQPLLVYGKAVQNETILIRLFAPDGTIKQFGQIIADRNGDFNHILIKWPNATSDYAYGTYSVEGIATKENFLSETANVEFAASTSFPPVTIQRNVVTTVYAPQTAAANQTFRVFVQVTSDGQLVTGSTDILKGSHVHTPSNTIIDLTTSFQKLHDGLFFSDFTPSEEGTYVFHIISSFRGTSSQGSTATQVLKQSIEGISNQIINLNKILSSTTNELDKLKTEIQGFGEVLNTSQNSITKANENMNRSVSSMSDSVKNLEAASGQFNSLFLPVVALIAIIIALQITILARRR